MKIEHAPEDKDLQLRPPVGRPRREEGKRPSAARSVRLPIKLWKQLARKAKREKKTLNAAMREAAQGWLGS